MQNHKPFNITLNFQSLCYRVFLPDSLCIGVEQGGMFSDSGSSSPGESEKIETL